MFLLRCVFVHNRNSSPVKTDVSMLRQAVFIGLLFPLPSLRDTFPRKRGKGFCARRLRTRQEFVACQNGCVDASPSGIYWAFIPPFRRYATPSPACGGRDFVPGGFVHDRHSSPVKTDVLMLRQAVFIGLLFPPSVATRHLPPQARGRDFVPGGHRCLHLSKVVKMAVKTKETSCFLAGEPRLGFVVQVASCVLRGKHTRGEGVSAERIMESWASRYFCLPPSLRGISRYS